MASDKGLYWIALGVLALGVSNSLVNQHTGCFRSLAVRAAAIAQNLSAKAIDRIAMGEAVLGRGQATVARTQTAMDRAQVRMAFVQTVVARRQAEIVRLQNERVQAITRERISRAIARCPRKTVTVEAPPAPTAPDDGTI
jgi:hypothetical protein